MNAAAVARFLCTEAKRRPLAFVFRRGVGQARPAGQTVAEAPWLSCPAGLPFALAWRTDTRDGPSFDEAGQPRSEQESKVHVQIRVIRDINRHFN